MSLRLLQSDTPSSCTQINVDDFDREAIRRVVNGFYERHEHPTVLSLLAELKSKQLVCGSRSTLHQLLKEMDLCYSKHENKKYIYEQPHISHNSSMLILEL